MKCSRCKCQEAAPGYKACQRCRDYNKSRPEQHNAAQRAYYARNTESKKEAVKAFKQLCIDEKRYHCEACDFTTSGKTHLTRHEGTRKHARNTAPKE